MAAAQPRTASEAAQAGLGESRRLAFNFGLLAAGEFVSKLLAFAAFSFFARTVGPETYGALEFTIALMVFFTLPADLGLGAYGAREIAKHPNTAMDLFREIAGMRLLLAACSFTALMILVASLNKTVELKLLIVVYGLSLFGGPLLLQWFFQAHDAMHWVAAASIVRQLTFATLMFLLFRAERSVLVAGFIECASVFATGAFCYLVMRYRMRVPFRWPSFHRAALLGHLREAVPIGLTELAWAFMWYFATVLLGVVFANAELGWFGASHRVTMALHTFVWLYFFNLLPSISRCVALPASQLIGLMNRSMRLAAWTAMFVGFSLTAMSKQVLILLYGPDFGGAAASFTILVWMLPVALLSGHYRYALIAYNRQRELLWCTAVAAAAAVLLGITLVPMFGAAGAAVALLTANLLNFGLVYHQVRQKIVRIRFRRQLPHPALAMVFAAAIFLMLRSVDVWLAYGLSILAFPAVLGVFQGKHVAGAYRVLRGRRSHRGANESWAG